MGKNKLLALLLVLLLALCACQAAMAPKPQTNPIRFYYCRQQADYGAQTGALAYETVDLERSDLTVEQILARYLRGPEDESLRSPFPSGLSCVEAVLDGDLLTLRMNEALNELEGVDLTLACACITLTLTQIDFIDGVRIQTQGTTPAAQTGVVLTAKQFLLYDEAAINPEWTVPLYFIGRNDGLLHTEERTLSYTSVDQLPLLALQALLGGAEEHGNRSDIPEHTQIIDLSISDGLCTLVLSESFSDCDASAETAVGAVRQIAATLCAFESIDAVYISLLDGSALENFDLTDRCAPEESWFAAQ